MAHEAHTSACHPSFFQFAVSMGLLASVLDYFNDVDDDEVPRLHEQAKVIFARVQGTLSPNVATCERNLGNTYDKRARRAYAANDLDRNVANLELALPHYRESVRIHRAINHMDMADKLAQAVLIIEKNLQAIAAGGVAATRG